LRTALAACFILLSASFARAQSPAPAPAAPDFFTRYDFHLNAKSLSGDDPRFAWDAQFGGDFDLVDFVKGRASVLIDYQPVLGSRLRPFDPEQAYYVLETSGSYRQRHVELAFVFHHVSRHLSDRAKEFSIAYNVMGARALRRIEFGGVTIDARADVGKVIQHSYVDYSWTADSNIMIRRSVNPHLGVFVHGYGEMFGVDGTLADRETQTGGLVEAGIRINGRAGAIELFAGIERRIDAEPIERLSRRWGIWGFRLLSK